MQIHSDWGNFIPVLTVFFLIVDGLRCPVKESCPYKVVAHCSEVCLHPYPLHCRDHHIEEMEHPLHEGEGMFHRRSDPGYPDISAYTLNWK